VTQQVVPTRLKAASGSSDLDDAREAGRIAATEAVAGLGGAAPALVVVFASVRYDLSAMLDGIREVTGQATVVGETSAGHFRDGRLIEPGTGVAVLAMTAGPYAFSVAKVDDLAANPEKAGSDLARAARDGAGRADSRYGTVMLFADGMAPDQQALITGMHRVAGAAVPIVGGAAADDRALTRTSVFLDGAAYNDAAVAVWIASDQPLAVTVGHGWHAIGLPLLVTKVDGQIVHEIAGRPAREVFEQYIRHGDTVELDGIRIGGYYSTHAFGLIEPDGSLLIRGVFRGEDGLVRTFAPLPVYSAIQIVACEPDRLLSTSRNVVQRALADRHAAALIVFSCIARLDVLDDQGPAEAEAVQATAGDVPVFGVYTYGEFARVSSVAGYHNATIAVLAL
jgi:hypothetical protein